jgi:hypothetical protein
MNEPDLINAASQPPAASALLFLSGATVSDGFKHGRVLFQSSATPCPFTSLVAVKARLRFAPAAPVAQHGRLLFQSSATPCPFTSLLAAQARLRSRAVSDGFISIPRRAPTLLSPLTSTPPRFGDESPRVKGEAE